MVQIPPEVLSSDFVIVVWFKAVSSSNFVLIIRLNADYEKSIKLIIESKIGFCFLLYNWKKSVVNYHENVWQKLANFQLNNDPQNWVCCDEIIQMLMIDSKSWLILDYDSIIFDTQTSFDLIAKIALL